MPSTCSACAASGKAPDPVVAKIAEQLAGNKTGPDLRRLPRLAKVIPAIKEVVMSGTYTKEFTTTTKGGKERQGGRGGNHDGQLYIFNADSEPDLEVAVAVHASASFPGVFKPVDIKIASGIVVRFVDGGVMNNTPTSVEHRQRARPRPDAAAARRDLRLRRRSRRRRQPAQGQGDAVAGPDGARRRLVRRQQQRRRRVRQEQVGAPTSRARSWSCRCR